METFVNRLVRTGLMMADRSVAGAIRGELQNVTTRTEQRRVLQVTGLTLGTIHQIERARRATLLLKRERRSSMWFTRRVITTRRISPGRCSASSGKARPASREAKSSCRFYTISSRRRSLRCDCDHESGHNHADVGSALVRFQAMPRLGAGLTGLVVLFLAFDGITKVIRVTPVMEACQKMGIGSDLVAGIGMLLLACTALYVIPKTAILGAILLTGYLGGAAATHVIARAGNFPIFFAIGFGGLVWAGLILREPRLVRWILLRQY